MSSQRFNPQELQSLPGRRDQEVLHSHTSGAPSSGRVRHDDRGTAVWDWAVATGVLARSRPAELLQLLDNPILEIEDRADPVTVWAGDPYNRG